MVGVALRTETPEDIVALAGEIDGSVTFSAVTEAAGADRLAAAVVIGDEIVLTVRRIVTGSHPGNGRGFRTRRAGGHAATAAGT